MSKLLHILIVEDSEDDALLLARELRRGGYNPLCERVEDPQAMRAALARRPWEVVIADFTLPHFSAPAALALLKESGLDLPFIIISGTVGEDTAVAAMKAGAHDYLSKGNLARLIPAIERELREAQTRRQRRQAEQDLLDRERLFRALIENAADVVSLLEATGLISYISPAVTRVLGYTPEELKGLNVFDFLHPDDVAYQTEQFQQLLDQPYTVITSQVRFRHKDDSWRWLEAVGTNLLAEPGVQAIVVNYHDITERKQAETEIRQRNRELVLLNQIIAASAAALEPVSVLEIACRELTLAFDLPRATAMLFNETQTEGKIVAEYLATSSGKKLSDNQVPMLGHIYPIATTRTFQHLLVHHTPLIIANTNNDPRLDQLRELFQQRHTGALLMLPMLNEGQVLGALILEASEPRSFSTEEVNLAWSVADQVVGALVRARLSQIHKRLSAAVEQAAESVIITDTEGIILYVNPAFERTSSYSRAEVIGQTPRLLMSGHHDQDFYEELWATISQGQVWHGRFVNKRKDGVSYTEEATVAPVRDEHGAILNYVSVQRNISRELQLEEQYRQAQKMEAIGRLAGGVAHDFNNLLVVITGYSELLLDRHFDEVNPLRKYVEEIKKAGERAARLTQQLLAFSRRQVLQPVSLDLNEVVADMQKMLKCLIGENIDLVARLEPGLGRIKADPGQMEQVILNLTINSRDAMPDGGKLTLETANVDLDKSYADDHPGTDPGRYVMLAVSDTGLGMDKPTLARIFEPFFTTKAQGRGTGLGLATTYGIIKQSGGDIWVYSELGHGSVFKVYLPRVEEDMAVSKPPPNLLDLPGGTETILFVEDEEAVRNLSRHALELSGYTILEAHHGGEALLLSEQQSGTIHLLITDVIMPGGLNGRELAERLKPIRPEMKVLYISGYTDDAIIHQDVLEAGVHFLQKPFSPSSLAQKVRQVLDMS